MQGGICDYKGRHVQFYYPNKITSLSVLTFTYVAHHTALSTLRESILLPQSLERPSVCGFHRFVCTSLRFRPKP